MANVVEIILRGVDQYSRGFTTAIKDMTSLKAAAGSLYTTFLGAAAAAAGALTTLTAQAIRNADEMGKMAQRTAIPVETLSRLVHAAQMSDVAASDLEIGIKALSKTMSEALRDSSSESAQRFANLGISLTDAQGKMVATDQILLQLSDRFANFKDNAAKADLALQFFGRSGTQILPFLNEGSEGIKRLGSEAAIVTDEMARTAEAVNDNLDRLKQTSSLLGMEIARRVLPSLNSLLEFIVALKPSAQGLGTAVDVVIQSLRYLALGAVGAFTAIQILGNFVAHTAALFQEEFRLAIELGMVALRAFLDVLKEAWGMLQSIGRALMDVGGALRALAQRDFEEAKRLATEALAELATASLDIGDKVKTGLATISSAYKDMVVRDTALAKGLWGQFIQDSLQDALNLVGVMQALFPKQMGMPAQGGPGAATTPGRKPTDDAALYLQQVQLTNDKILKFEQDLGRKMKTEYERQLRDRIAGQQAALGATANLFGNLAALSSAFGKKNFALTQAFSIAQAVVNTAGGVVRALNDYQFPYSIIVGALVAAAGAVQIATIAATKPSGVAHGGLDYVPSTGTYILERGEAVLQARQNQALGEFLESRDSGRAIVVNVDGEPLFRLIADGLRNGRIEVPTRSLV